MKLSAALRPSSWLNGDDVGRNLTNSWQQPVRLFAGLIVGPDELPDPPGVVDIELARLKIPDSRYGEIVNISQQIMTDNYYALGFLSPPPGGIVRWNLTINGVFVPGFQEQQVKISPHAFGPIQWRERIPAPGGSEIVYSMHIDTSTFPGFTYLEFGGFILVFHYPDYEDDLEQPPGRGTRGPMNYP